MTLTTHNDGTTVLDSPVLNQAVLRGLLTKLRDLGLPLLSLTQVDANPQTPSQTSSVAWQTTLQGD